MTAAIILACFGATFIGAFYWGYETGRHSESNRIMDTAGRDPLRNEFVAAIHELPLGHNHWDKTGQHGAGCELCRLQFEAKNALLDLLPPAEKGRTHEEG